MIYNIKNNHNEIKLFDKKFIKNNRDNCILSINNKIIDICEYYSINKELKEKNIKLSIIQKNKIINMSNMFSNCTLLSSLLDISKWNTRNVEDMSNMFFHCTSLLSLPAISKWNTSNVKDMSNIFSHCTSLSLLPDITK